MQSILIVLDRDISQLHAIAAKGDTEEFIIIIPVLANEGHGAVADDRFNRINNFVVLDGAIEDRRREDFLLKFASVFLDISVKLDGIVVMFLEKRHSLTKC